VVLKRLGGWVLPLCKEYGGPTPMPMRGVDYENGLSIWGFESSTGLTGLRHITFQGPKRLLLGFCPDQWCRAFLVSLEGS